MPKLAANLTMMFGEVPFLDRFEPAARPASRASSICFRFDHPAQALKQKLRDHGLTQVLHNLPARNWAGGERGVACLPDRVDEFKAGVDRAIEYARTLECDRVNCLAGILSEKGCQPGRRAGDVHEQPALRGGAPRRGGGIKLLIEAINTRDLPGFFLADTPSGRRHHRGGRLGQSVRAVQHLPHPRCMEGHLAKTIEGTPAAHRAHTARRSARAARAGNRRNRHGFLLDFINRAGYDGWIGCESFPKAGTVEGLGWAKRSL